MIDEYISVNDISGKRLLPTRFLRKIVPPHHIHEILSNSGNVRAAVELAAHMVSCIPFVADPVMFPGVCDLWTTAEQLLTIGCGDEEEHAILLVCWLMFLNVSAVLVLGNGLPEGTKTAYILIQTENDTFLVNPSDGNVYSINDSMCPLLSIGTIITNDNCYANIQKNCHPSTMDFDLNVGVFVIKHEKKKYFFRINQTGIHCFQQREQIWFQFNQKS